MLKYPPKCAFFQVHTNWIYFNNQIGYDHPLTSYMHCLRLISLSSASQYTYFENKCFGGYDYGHPAYTDSSGGCLLAIQHLMVSATDAVYGSGSCVSLANELAFSQCHPPPSPADTLIPTASPEYITWTLASRSAWQRAPSVMQCENDTRFVYDLEKLR